HCTGQIPGAGSGGKRDQLDGRNYRDHDNAKVVDAMIPILFAADAETFTSQGIGPLGDAISCEVTEERNGVYELEMQYPVTGIHFEDIQNRCILAAIPSPYRTRQ